jgi:outer membrane protein assembly factor BamB
MQILSKKTAVILVTALLMLSMTLSLFPKTSGQLTNPAGTVQTSYSYVKVGPNPIGVGQLATIVMFVAQPTATSESVRNWTVVITNPSGAKTTLGPFTSDATGGTDTTFTPNVTGNWTIQAFVGRQVLVNGVIWTASSSNVETLVVQSAPVTLGYYPITALPTSWWQTPINAENVQNWYAIAGPWLGYGSVTFAATGGYNNTGMFNPYTEPVLSGHVLWTTPWCEGGVAGGQAGGTELSNYWSTNQYWPKFAPVVINGILYSTRYVETNSYSDGIIAIDLYNGQTLWTINNQNTLLCGMVTQWKTPNMYGVIGPYIWATGSYPGVYTAPFTTEWNMYSALTGEYVLSVVNGTTATLTTDSYGDIIGYYINSTYSPGTQYMTTYAPAPPFGTQPVTGHVSFNSQQPLLVCWNLSQALGNSWGWGPSLNSVIDFGLGVVWAKPVYTSVGGQALNTPLAVNGVTGNAVVMTGGFTFGQFFGGLQEGYTYVAAQSASTGAQLWIKNFTATDSAAFEPWTRTQMNIQDGLWINVNEDNDAVFAVNAGTGTVAWTLSLPAGINTNGYDVFNLKTYNALGALIVVGFGGDIWSINDSTGKVMWQTNTISILGNPGLETPYATWPLWVFSCDCMTNDVGYFAIGHEYNPPLFHGAQLLALNMTTGKLIWSELDFSVESTEISYGIVLSRNAYDNQIYAFGKGPSATTVTAPDIGVTTATPITITGTVLDVSAGTQQQAVKANFPYGVPCVSDQSESHFMEYVYQQQPEPTNVTGVPVTLSETDANGNSYTIGTTRSNSSGTFAYNWTPPIAGNYTIVATFAGSNSYYGSCAETHIYASAPPATPGPTASPVTGLASTSTVEYGIAAVIIVIIIIGAVLALLMMRKRP